MEASANLLRSRDGNNTPQPVGKGCKTSLADSIPAPSMLCQSKAPLRMARKIKIDSNPAIPGDSRSVLRAGAT